jgi:class 3 adenylate cyclase
MPDLPSGTVTFLFSDIEGSTQLLQRLGMHYAPVLGEHQALLRVAWAAHGGAGDAHARRHHCTPASQDELAREITRSEESLCA